MLLQAGCAWHLTGLAVNLTLIDGSEPPAVVAFKEVPAGSP